jgi:zinc D-Ala-D-Ala dipeptidase
MNSTFHCLEAKELKQIIPEDNDEPLVSLEDLGTTIICRHRGQRKHNFLKILIRQTVATKLQDVQRRLQTKYPDRQLVVVEGYRHPYIQEREFLYQFAKLSRQYLSMDVVELEEKVHQWVALPSVAGHPTGGAIDVTLAENGKEIDMSGAIADFSKPADLPTFASGLTRDQQANRLLLHDLMLEGGFAPFYGEWWHFSYGDREWAAFYAKGQTLYSPLYLPDDSFSGGGSN